ncbi:hypothetical protein CRG98_015166 [Punica granatum]|uniref:UDP-glycosyltransferase 89A2-like n=1 Tax=Punica granatum TaxID=22663 RepID=A0A2I0K7B2_PUNGR|nr:hypothetical protein CRG98_015166 [Punica granatum]
MVDDILVWLNISLSWFTGDYCWRNLATVRSLEVVPLPDIPNTPSFREEHLPFLFRFYRESDPDWENIKDGMIANTSSYGCIFNSFEALEGQYLAHLKRKMGHGRVYGVGPLSLVGLSNGSDPANPDDAVFRWLDGHSDGSVLYVCFGSQKVMRKDQVKALACGLENSGAHFIWVVKMSSAEEVDNGVGPFLDEFEMRVAGRGMIIRGWAPQVAILGHRAVGRFLSHCGWNSVLEAIVAGVVLLAWPMQADQYVNARLLVEDMGVAFRVCEGADTVPDPEKLSQAISGLMGEDAKERARARELTDRALAAAMPEGSSSRDLDALVKEVFLLDQVQK